MRDATGSRLGVDFESASQFAAHGALLRSARLDGVGSTLLSRTGMKRFLWLDVAKGLAILCVVYFHFFTTYFEHGALPPPDWSGLAASVTTILGLVWLRLTGLGFH